jgi:hypothetical protein
MFNEILNTKHLSFYPITAHILWHVIKAQREIVSHH